MKQFENQFHQEVYKGLTAEDKHLSSKWFYDDTGSKIFQQIMTLDEYYPTRCEYEIFIERDLPSMISTGEAGIDIIELGAGDGYKTKVLLKKMLDQGLNLSYKPIDISVDILRTLKANLEKELPLLTVEPLEGHYFEVLKNIKSHSARPKLILFLGSSIGNLLHPVAIDFLSRLADTMLPEDQAMIGFDLKKDPATVLAAYNDKTGMTARFNLNVLDRINKELGGDFDLSKFIHYPVYDPMTGTCLSYLVSTAAQRVAIPALDLTVIFEKWETLQTEISQKYTHKIINWLLAESGLQAVDYVTDSKGWFAEYIIKKRA